LQKFCRFCVWLFRQRVPAAQMIIHNRIREAAWSISYALFYVLAAVATGMLIRAHPLPLLGAADFTQDFWYAVVFKIGLLLIVPLTVFWRAGYRFSAMLPEWKVSGGSIFRVFLAYLAGVAVNFSRVRGIVGALLGFQGRSLCFESAWRWCSPFSWPAFLRRFSFAACSKRDWRESGGDYRGS